MKDFSMHSVYHALAFRDRGLNFQGNCRMKYFYNDLFTGKIQNMPTLRL